MEYVRKNTSNIPYSLHDSKIQIMEYQNNTLTIFVDKVFEYTEQGEKMYPATIVFSDIDLEDCSVLLFDNSLCDCYSKFCVQRISLLEFIQNYKEDSFEILTETYNVYDTVLIGEIWQQNKDNTSAIINLRTMGKMIYILEDEIILS